MHVVLTSIISHVPKKSKASHCGFHYSIVLYKTRSDSSNLAFIKLWIRNCMNDVKPCFWRQEKNAVWCDVDFDSPLLKGRTESEDTSCSLVCAGRLFEFVYESKGFLNSFASKYALAASSFFRSISSSRTVITSKWQIYSNCSTSTSSCCCLVCWFSMILQSSAQGVLKNKTGNYSTRCNERNILVQSCIA